MVKLKRLSCIALLTLSCFVSAFSQVNAAELNNTKTDEIVISKPDSNKVNINSASAEELAEKLKGIGLKKAEKIVEYRQTYGNFTQPEQLQEVSGIGITLFERNSAVITVD